MALETMAGWDSMDSTSSQQGVPKYTEEIARSVKGLTLGVPKEYFPEGIDEEVHDRVREGVETLRSLGVQIRDVSLPHTPYANPTYVLISGAEASSNLARYDGIHYGHRTQAPSDLLQLYSRSRVEGFGPEVKRRIMVGTFVLSSGYYDAFYSKACKVRNLIRKDFEEVFREVDGVICPTSPVPAFPLGDKIDDPLKLYAVDVLTVPANLASLPGISFPCGFTKEHLPVGLQIYGRPFEDGTVLQLANAFQEATSFHAQPPPVRAWSVGD
jgi:aspartyl-tRNA(Asn)/glutamyl-tRNA(Gln) amidotransferase subunit A